MLTVNLATGFGGVIHISVAFALIVKVTSLIGGNFTPQEGGGIWNQTGCVLDISETHITNNGTNGVASKDSGAWIVNNG